MLPSRAVLITSFYRAPQEEEARAGTDLVPTATGYLTVALRLQVIWQLQPDCFRALKPEFEIVWAGLGQNLSPPAGLLIRKIRMQIPPLSYSSGSTKHGRRLFEWRRQK